MDTFAFSWLEILMCTSGRRNFFITSITDASVAFPLFTAWLSPDSGFA